MTIDIKRMTPPMFNEFTVFEKINPQLIIDTSKVIVSASVYTKTRIHTSIKIGKSQKGVNWKMDGYNTHEVNKTNFFTYEQEVHNYFTVTKKQSYDQYIEYIKDVVERFCENHGIADKINELTVIFYDRFNNWK